ncbi:MAG: Excinuclease ATPase subunit [uncultured Paraburkholderia sp.]|uniref:excinuclease ABC subunit A n=1 Tax=uncultured Paraburkholderia sp. TaxID=1822466 RepID=UPI002599B38D|nr:excinuclease ABC subunit A [uncultured Paraburkholderia sp.]CAH2896484.1 MAG: Excinuclease ATPase subunit [uncultured Paraburkholderia sp.]CAH2922574.1 MAG: Excinuclease ATPase subunit [uncultured Paraburkholderia sp.]
MKRHLMFVTLAASLSMLSAAPVFARDSVGTYPINEALHSEPGKVGDDIQLYFAGQRHPAVAKTIGEFATNKKTNAFGKSDEAACQHVFLSAVIELQDRARKEGGNAVINIKSNYKNEVRESATEFTCGAGAVIAGVALKGDVVTLRK